MNPRTTRITRERSPLAFIDDDTTFRLREARFVLGEEDELAEQQERIAKPMTKLKVKRTLHPNRDTRSMTHRPQSDWRETNAGEECRNSCSLEVGDIVSKYARLRVSSSG